MKPALELGLGAQEILSVPGTGRVVGVYSKAVYLRLPGGLVALTTFDVPSGPVHARTSVPIERLRLGDQVVLTELFLQAGPALVNLENPRVWKGATPASDELVETLPLALRLLESAPPSALDPKIVDTTAALLAGDDLAAAAVLLGGRGPGLTPAGDDCLAGILLVAAIASGGAASSDLRKIAESVDTNDVSRTFLKWSALGQCIEPVHRFLVLVSRDAEGASDALQEVTNLGHSSGADMALGLRLALGAHREVSARAPGTDR